MERINFNDYSAAERYQIISAFLKKTLAEGPGSGAAERFFEFYFEKFYKIPKDICNDIIYCQRAMRAHLQVHQLVVQVFAQQEDADPVQKDRFLRELEAKLYEMNAECSYLTMRMQDDIDSFCKVFVENDIKCNKALIQTLISHSIVPQVCNTKLVITPITVQSRDSEQALVKRFFTISEDEAKSKAEKGAGMTESNSAGQIVATVDITEDDEDDLVTIFENNVKVDTKAKASNNVTSNVGKNERRKTALQPQAPPLLEAKNERRRLTGNNANIGNQMPTLKTQKPKQVVTTTVPQVSILKNVPKRTQNAENMPKNKNNDSATATTTAAAAAAAKPSTEPVVDRVKESRLNLLQVLKRTRNERMRSDKQINTATKASTTQKNITTQQLSQASTSNKAAQSNNSAELSAKNVAAQVKSPFNDKETFLRTLGLCNQEEYKRMLQVHTQLKRRSCNKIRPVGRPI